MKKVHLIIFGNVQGIFFRSNIKKIADQYNVRGFAKNKKDGSVEVVLEGDNENVDKIIEFCKKGPSGAKIEKINIKEKQYKKEFNDFSIKY